MFDLYALPQDFPGYDEAKKCTSAYQRVALLEQALSRDIGSCRFVPYIQLHEFEALIFADPSMLVSMYPDSAKTIEELVELSARVHNPEQINLNDPPSKRIIVAIPGYDKALAAAEVAETIGLDKMRQACPHFGNWLSRLESLAGEANYAMDNQSCL